MENKSYNQRKGYSLIILLIVSVCLILPMTMVNAYDEYGPYRSHKQNTDLEFTVNPVNATSCNVTTLEYPLGVLVINKSMTKFYSNFNITINKTYFSTLGDYCFNIECSNSYQEETGSICRTVTYTGDLVSTEQIYVYILAIVFLVLLSVGIIFIISKLPSSDSRDETGAIVQISMLKHLRPVLWSTVWIISLSCIFIISNIAIAYLSNDMISNLLFVIWQIGFWFTIIALPIYFIWIFYKVFADKETQKLIERGVEIRTP